MRNSGSLLTGCLLLLLASPWIHPQVQQLAAFWSSGEESANYLFIRPESAPENPALFQLFATSSLIASKTSAPGREPAELVHDFQEGNVRFELWITDHPTAAARQIRAVVVPEGVSLCLKPLETVPEGATCQARLLWDRLVDGRMEVPLQFDFPLQAPQELRF